MKAMPTVFSVADGTQLYVRLRVWQTAPAKPATAHIQLFRWLDRTCYAIGVANDIANQGDVQILKAGMRGQHCRVRIYPARCGFIQHVADLSSTLRIYPARCGFIQHVADLSSTLRIYPARCGFIQHVPYTSAFIKRSCLLCKKRRHA